MIRPAVTAEQLDAFIREYAPEPPRPDPQPAPRGQSAGPRTDAVRRCAGYMRKVAPSIEGQKGSDRVYQAARIIWNDFGIDEPDGYPLLEEYNRNSRPPWTEEGSQGLRRKWNEAVAKGPGPEGRGHKLAQDRPGYTAPPNGNGAPRPEPPTAAEPTSEPGDNPFKMIDSADFLKGDYRPRWLVPRILVRGQPGVIAGPSKGMKTSLLVDLAVSLATATPFLGEFPIRERVRVAIVSGESGEHTLKETCLRVLTAKGLSTEAVSGWLKWEFTLPTFSDLGSMTQFGTALARVQADVVFIDPTYLALGDVDAKNLFEMGAALRSVVVVLRALRPDLTVILVHHANRMLPIGEPMELQHLAYSGLEQFARQFLLLNRREAYRNDGEHDIWVRAGGSTGQGGLWAVQVSEGLVEEDFSGRRWDVKVTTPEGVRESDASAKRQEANARKLESKQLDERAVMLVIDAEAVKGFPGATLSWIGDHVEFSDARAKTAIERLLDAGALVKIKFDRPIGNKASREVEGYGRPQKDGSATV